MKSVLLSALMLIPLLLFAKHKPTENPALCKITTLFENPEIKKAHEEQVKKALLALEDMPDTQYIRDGRWWNDITQDITKYTRMKVADFDAEPPKDHTESAGFVSFWLSAETAETQTFEAGPTQAEDSTGHSMRWSLAITDLSGKVLWEKHSRWKSAGEGYRVSGTTVLTGREYSWGPNVKKVLDGLAKQLGKDAGCQR